MGVAYDSLDFDAAFTIDIRGRLGDRSVRPHFQTVRVRAVVATDEAVQRLAAVIAEAEARCPEMNLLTDAKVDLRVEWLRDSGETLQGGIPSPTGASFSSMMQSRRGAGRHVVGVDGMGGDHREFLDATLPYLDVVWQVARHAARDGLEPEDLVQETYLRAYAAFGSFRGGNARAWLAAICLNAARSEARRRGRRPREVPGPGAAGRAAHGPRG